MVLINNSNETKTIKPIDSKKTLRTSKRKDVISELTFDVQTK
jgi:hypothetical protein